MAKITFYEKPGCGNNTKQKALLAAAGHEVVARNLLTEPWTSERLLAFFGTHPVADWFNRASPRIRLSRSAAHRPLRPLPIRSRLRQSGRRKKTEVSPTCGR